MQKQTRQERLDAKRDKQRERQLAPKSESKVATKKEMEAKIRQLTKEADKARDAIKLYIHKNTVGGDVQIMNYQENFQKIAKHICPSVAQNQPAPGHS
jgi:hypothetical protein